MPRPRASSACRRCPEDSRRQMIDSALSRHLVMQIPPGHFSMWGGDSYVNEMIPLHRPVPARRCARGRFAIPDGVLQKALKRDSAATTPARAATVLRLRPSRPPALRHRGLLFRVAGARATRAPLRYARAVRQRARQVGHATCRWCTWGRAEPAGRQARRNEKPIAEGFAKQFGNAPVSRRLRPGPARHRAHGGADHQFGLPNRPTTPRSSRPGPLERWMRQGGSRGSGWKHAQQIALAFQGGRPVFGKPS